jgi:hypothetical protein
LYEYQKKRLTKKAFRKRLILKDGILVVLGLQSGNGYLETEKREQAPALQMQFFTRLSIPENKGKSRKILGGCRQDVCVDSRRGFPSQELLR